MSVAAACWPPCLPLPQWFMDRILRDRPVPIPAPGIQLTSLSHVEARGAAVWGGQRRADKCSGGTAPRGAPAAHPCAPCSS